MCHSEGYYVKTRLWNLKETDKHREQMIRPYHCVKFLHLSNGMVLVV